MGSSGRFYCSLTFLIITKGLLKQPFPSTSELCALWHLDFDTSSRIIRVYSCQVIAHLKCSTKCWSAWFTNSPQRASSADGAPWGRPLSVCLQPSRFSELRLLILASPQGCFCPVLVFVFSSFQVLFTLCPPQQCDQCNEYCIWWLPPFWTLRQHKGPHPPSWLTKSPVS